MKLFEEKWLEYFNDALLGEAIEKDKYNFYAGALCVISSMHESIVKHKGNADLMSSKMADIEQEVIDYFQK